MRNLIWIDPSDSFALKDKLSSLRSQFANCDWVSWSEDDYPSVDDALEDFERQVCMSPMFSEGRIVLCRGLPGCHSDMAKHVVNMVDGVCLILIARPDTRLSLHKAALALGDRAKVEDALDIGNGVDWLVNRAKTMGVKLDGMAAAMLVDFLGPNPAVLLMNVEKLRYLSPDDSIMPWMVEQHCPATDANLLGMCQRLVGGNLPAAQQQLYRLLAQGTSPRSICAFMSEWLRKLAIAESCKGDSKEAQDFAKQLDEETGKHKLLRWDELTEREKEEKRRQIIKLNDQLMTARKGGDNSKLRAKQKESVETLRGKSVPMYAKPGALYYACKDWTQMGLPRGRVLKLIKELGAVERETRGGAAQESLLRFLSGFINEQRK